MQFPKSVHAEGWHAHMPERSLPPMPLLTHDVDDAPARGARRLHVVVVAAVALCALIASAGLDLADDPSPLDLQLSRAVRGAGELLNEWQGQLSRGLQVSLRAVADGRDTLAQDEAAPPEATTLLAQTGPAPSAAADARDGLQPVRADLAPRARAR